ncbi:MAG: YncE family protein [Nitrososphaerales archaeon]|nr:YncE family protein [Nitrososphaerales archaeon]
MKSAIAAVVLALIIAVSAGVGYLGGVANQRTANSISTTTQAINPTVTSPTTYTTTYVTTSIGQGSTTTYTTTSVATRTVTITTGTVVTEVVIFPTGSANGTFQFVGATVTGLASGIAVNATYKNNTPISWSAVLAGTAYPAKADYVPVYGGQPFGPICCPIVRNYTANGSTTSFVKANVGAGGTFSSSIVFPSLNGSIYWVRILPLSLNGTSLSPASFLLVETSTAQGNKSGNACGGQEGAGPLFYDRDNGLVYVINPGTDAVSAIDGVTGRLVTTISLPDLVGGLGFQLYDPGNKELYVANQYTNEVFPINTSTNRLAGKMIVSQPGQSLGSMVYDPLNGNIFGINFVYSLISVINGSTNKAIVNITGIHGPLGAWFNPRNNELYVQAYNGTVYAMNGDTYKIVAAITMPQYAGNFLFNPDNGVIYGISGYTVLIINSSSNTLAKTTIPLPPPPNGTIGFYYKPVLYNPTNKEIYVYGMALFDQSNQTSSPDKLVVIDTANNSLVASIPVRGLGGGLVIETPSFFYDPSTGNVYATTLLNQSNGTAGLLEISGQTNKVISQVTLSGIGFGVDMAFDSSTRMMFGADWQSEVLIVNPSSGALVATTVFGSCSYSTLPA